MAGPGFRFEAPRDWVVSSGERGVRARSRSDASLRVSATLYRLGKAYSPDQFASAAKELDGVAAKLARAAGGSVVASETTTVDGRKVRAYRFTAHDGGRDYENRVGFVLSGRREVQLLCQTPAGADDRGACPLLFSSFSLTGGD